MTKILGLDLGTNSIGWAIINKESEKIIDMGVRIFKAGVENLGQGEKEISKNASRTAARGTRRQYFRRKIRRKHILKILKENKMCPIDETQFQAWIKLNPYELRYRATFEKIGLIELGRIFFHLSKRRGFLSNSRSALANSDGTIFKGGNGKIGISATSENLNNGTLGNYLYNILPKENTPHKGGLPRVRNRYTTRQMYIEEFEQIWNTQAKFHNILTDELKDKIGGRKKDGYKNDGILFYQRPLRSQKHKVGKCTFEPTKTKSPISAIPYELFRAWQFINNIECNGEKLSESEKQMVLEVIKSKDKKFNFSVIRKKLKLADADYKFNYQNDDKVTGCPTIAKLSHKKCFGKEWDQLSNEEKDKIWHVIYFFDDKEKLKQYAKSKWGFDDTKAEYVSKIYFKPDYGSLSRKAIDNILEFLEMGFQYDIAVALGGVKNVFGKDRWSGLSVSDKNFILDNVPNIVRSNLTGGYAKALKKALQSQFQFSEKELRKLYHHSTNINDTKTVLKKLPTGAEADRQIGKIRNPIVIQALFELRKVVNALIDEYGSFDQINIELARDLKIPKTARQKIRLDNKSREKYHDDIKVELAKINQYPTHTNILKYKLWEECQHQCPYTGNEISLTQLYNGEVEIEHIIPYSRSLDDSYLNKTLCFTEENAAKGKQTPHEYYTSLGTWESVKSRALKLFYDSKKFPNRYKKYKRFITSRLDDNFISRQLNDTRYISKEAKAYLSMICDKVRVAPGQMTAKLRYFWGLNNIIGDENDAKSREDHRHHAIDALVMACHEASYLNEMSRWNRYNRSYDLREFPHPWDGFRYQAIEKVKRILVSHKQNNRVLTSRKYTVKKNGSKSTSTGIAARGQLTKDTVYGKRQSPYSGEHAYHIRKPIESLKNHKHVNSIVDKNVKKIILEFLKANGIDTASKFDIPSGLFLEVDKETGLTTPKVFMPNKNGNPVPIRNIRRKAAIGNAIQLKEAVNQWVDPRNNHHILIYVDKNGEQKESVVQFLEVVRRSHPNKKEPMYQLPEDGIEIIEILRKDKTYLLNLNIENINLKSIDYEIISKHLYRVQKLSSGYYTFRHHLASTINNKEEGISIQSVKAWKSANPIKVKISTIGKINL